MTDNLEAEARRVAAGLTKAQARVLKQADTSPGFHKAPQDGCHRRAGGVMSSMRHIGLVERGSMGRNFTVWGYRLTTLGLAVKRVLEAGL